MALKDISGTNTGSAITISTASNRNGFLIANTSDTVMYWDIGQAAVSATSFPLAAGATILIDNDKLDGYLSVIGTTAKTFKAKEF